MKAISYIFYTLVLITVLSGHAVAQKPTEYEVKAAFLFNFARFVEWPEEAFESPTSPFIIGILGRDPFGKIMEETVAQKTVKERSFVVRRFPSSQELQKCHLLFIAASEKNRLKEHLEQISNAPILTLSEIEGFCIEGGMANFVLIQNRVRIEVNPTAVTRAQLKMSSRLLKLAIIISEQTPDEGQ